MTEVRAERAAGAARAERAARAARAVTAVRGASAERAERGEGGESGESGAGRMREGGGGGEEGGGTHVARIREERGDGAGLAPQRQLAQRRHRRSPHHRTSPTGSGPQDRIESCRVAPSCDPAAAVAAAAASVITPTDLAEHAVRTRFGWHASCKEDTEALG